MNINNIFSKLNIKKNYINISLGENEIVIFSKLKEEENIEKIENNYILFSDDYYSFLVEKVSEYLSNKKINNVKLNVILPSKVIFNNIISVPKTREKSTDKLLDIMLNNQYKNRVDLTIKSKILYQDKDNVTYSIIGTKLEYINTIKAMLNTRKITINNITYSSQLLINNIYKREKVSGITIIVDKYNSLFYLLKEGILLGEVSVPFGSNVLDKECINESKLFKKDASLKVVLRSTSKDTEDLLSCYDECNSNGIDLFRKWIFLVVENNKKLLGDIKNINVFVNNKYAKLFEVEDYLFHVYDEINEELRYKFEGINSDIFLN